MSKNRFEYEGPLTRVDRFTTAKGKEILTLVFETGGQWPQFIAAKVFGRLAEQSSEWKPGAVLRVEGRLGGREYNSKIYTENVAESVELVSGQQALPAGSTPPVDDGDETPF